MTRRFVLRISGYAALVVLVTAGAAQSLAGSNTVYSDDIVNGTITHRDVKANSIGGSRLLDNAVTGGKILDGSVTDADLATNAVGSAEIADGAVTSAKVVDDSLGRDKLAFDPISDVVQVNSTRTYAANEVAGHIATCPNSSPVPLGVGYAFGTGGNEAGFVVRASIPLERGWVIHGQNILPQPRALTVYLLCADIGSGG